MKTNLQNEKIHFRTTKPPNKFLDQKTITICLGLREGVLTGQVKCII